MPDTQATQAVTDAAATDQTAAATAAAAQVAAGAATTATEEFDFDAWLEAQPSNVREGYEQHVAGLKSALKKERAKNKGAGEGAAASGETTTTPPATSTAEPSREAKELAALKAERDALKAKARAATARDVLRATAVDLKITFASAQAEQDALALALAAAQFNEDDEVEDPKALLKEVLKGRDYLKKAVPAAGGDLNTAARSNATAPAGMTPEQAREFAAVYGVNPAFVPTNVTP